MIIVVIRGLKLLFLKNIKVIQAFADQRIVRDQSESLDYIFII